MDTADSPRATPGVTPNPEEDRWLTAMEVATFIGKSERTARTWVVERGIPARAGRPERWSEHAVRIHLQNPRGNIGATPGATPETDPGQSGKLSKPIEATYRVTPAEIEQAVSRTSAQYMGDLRTMLVEVGKVYEGQLVAKDQTISTQSEVIAAKDEALTTKDQVISTQAETIAELRRRADVAEGAVRTIAEREAVLQAAQAAPVAPGATEGEDTDNPSGAPAPGFWARVRRVFGGE